MKWIDHEEFPKNFPYDLQRLMQDHRNFSMANDAPDYQSQRYNDRLLAFQNKDIIKTYLDLVSRHSHTSEPNFESKDVDQLPENNDQAKYIPLANRKIKQYYDNNKEKKMPKPLNRLDLLNEKNIPSSLRFNWEKIAMFSIITGKNGIGKSVLLEKASKHCQKQNKKVIYIKSDFQPSIKSYSSHKLLDEKSEHEFETETNVLTIFTSAIESFKDLEKRIANDPDPMDIIEFYNKTKSKQRTDTYTSDELSLIFSEHFIEKYNKSRIEREWGTNVPPEEEIKDFLNSYPEFNHKAFFEDDKLKFMTYTGEPVTFEQLSSGEKIILSVIAWQYCQQGYASIPENGVSRKADIILLDEIDKHLDPHLTKSVLNIIKKFFVDRDIQVIMTTHRIDTISLIPQDLIDNKVAEIFTIKNKKSVNHPNIEMKGEPDIECTKEIVPITKLEAMYRLTKNLRQFTGHRFEVYTEGFYDAYFYSGVYHSLLDMSKNTQRDRSNHYSDLLLPEGIMPKNLYATDVDTGEKKFIGRALSERYQMFFRGVSKITIRDGIEQIKGDGGCGDVKIMINRDFNALKETHHDLTELFTDKEFHIPYGLIDADNKCFEKTSENDDDMDYIKDRIVYPSFDKTLPSRLAKLGSRHSIENFLFDPLILCSSLSKDEIIRFIDKSLIIPTNKQEMKNICANIKSLLDDYAQRNSIQLEENVNSYFGVVALTVGEYISYSNDNLFSKLALSMTSKNSAGETSKKRAGNQKKLMKDHEVLQEKIEDSDNTEKQIEIFRKVIKFFKNPLSLDLAELSKQSQDVKFVFKGSNNNISIMTVKYPALFLHFRGHYLEHYCFGSKITDQIAMNIKLNGLKFIPSDLAQSFFDLNYLVRKNVREVIKNVNSQIQQTTNQSNLESDNSDNETSSDIVVDPIEGGFSLFDNDNINNYCITNILYNSTNQILRQDELLHQAGQFAGMDGINRLINLGEQDDDVAKGIITAARDYGISQVLNILMADIKTNPLTNVMVLNTDVANTNINIDNITLPENTSWVDRCGTEDRTRSYGIGL